MKTALLCLVQSTVANFLGLEATFVNDLITIFRYSLNLTSYFALRGFFPNALSAFVSYFVTSFTCLIELSVLNIDLFS